MASPLPGDKPSQPPPSPLVSLLVGLSVQGTGVAGHEDQGVAEVDLPIAGGEDQSAGVEHIEQGTDHFLAGLLDFIEQHDAGFAEGTLNLVQIKQAMAFLAAHVARRRAGECRRVMLLGQWYSCRYGTGHPGCHEWLRRSVRTVSVLPTPVGPRNRCTASGRLSSPMSAFTRTSMDSHRHQGPRPGRRCFAAGGP